MGWHWRTTLSPQSPPWWLSDPTRRTPLQILTSPPLTMPTTESCSMHSPTPPRLMLRTSPSSSKVLHLTFIVQNPESSVDQLLILPQQYPTTWPTTIMTMQPFPPPQQGTYLPEQQQLLPLLLLLLQPANRKLANCRSTPSPTTEERNWFF